MNNQNHRIVGYALNGGQMKANKTRVCMISMNNTETTKSRVYQDFSYGEILAGRPGAWLVKEKNYACNQKSLKRNLG